MLSLSLTLNNLTVNGFVKRKYNLKYTTEILLILESVCICGGACSSCHCATHWILDCLFQGLLSLEHKNTKTQNKSHGIYCRTEMETIKNVRTTRIRGNYLCLFISNQMKFDMAELSTAYKNNRLNWIESSENKSIQNHSIHLIGPMKAKTTPLRGI